MVRKNIFEPVKLHNFTAKNRLIRSATWEGIAEPDGSITPEAYEIYTELAKGGIGAVIAGFTGVSQEDYYIDGIMRLSNDELIPQFRKLTDIIHSENCPALVQLAIGAFYRNSRQSEPDQMTQQEIEHVISLFVQAAIRAKQANFDGVQIHAAHFFFLSRFISPRINHRTDIYGGSTINRSRILTEILAEIKRSAPDLHVSVKINSSDFMPNGLEETEALELCRILDEAGIDSIEVSGNGTSVPNIKPHINEAYFLNFAAALAEKVSAPVILVGGLRCIETMQKILDNTKIELLSLSRPLLCEPDLPNKFLSGSSSQSKCISCNTCYTSHAHRCVFR